MIRSILPAKSRGKLRFEVKLSTLQNSLDLGADANAQAVCMRNLLAVAKVMFFVGPTCWNTKSVGAALMLRNLKTLI